jgi:hypothetical protein
MPQTHQPIRYSAIGTAVAQPVARAISMRLVEMRLMRWVGRTRV